MGGDAACNCAEAAEVAAGALYREALPAIRSRRVPLVDNTKMVSQFVNLERRALGTERIDHPQRAGHHDDISVVVADCPIALATLFSPTASRSRWDKE